MIMHSATIWLTENCNLKCKYCYEGQEKGKKDSQYRI